jgi:uncharacterized membrane protein
VSVEGAGARRAAVLGAVTGARTLLAPAALALRGRLGKVAKFAVPVLSAGELVGDKLPGTPPRVEGPGLVGRVVSGAFVGRVSGGTRGARVGAAFALASTYPSQALRAQIVKRTPLPDLACAVPEDLLGIGLAAAASSEPRPDPAAEPPDVDGPKTGPIGRFSAHRPEARHGIVAAAVCGLAAAAVGTAAMTSAQKWAYGLTGGEESEAPAAVGEKILGKLGVKVKKEQRPALNTAMHVLYGTSWGVPFGVVWGRGERPPGPPRGLVFGLNVWLASLVELPALGIAPPPWRQPPAALAQDLAFHLVYGTATAAAYEAFTA